MFKTTLEVVEKVDMAKWSKEKAKDALMDAVATCLRVSKEVCPVRTGNLQRSIMPFRIHDLEWDVIANAPYSAYVEFGTRSFPGRKFMQRGAEAGMDILRRSLGE